MNNKISTIIEIIVENNIEVYKNYYCECPCHKRIPVRKNHKYHGIPRFIYGHQFGGKHHSFKSLEKISKNRTGKCAKEKHPNWNKPRLQKVKQKISKTLEGRHCSPRTEFSKNTIINGMTLSEFKSKENLSQETRKKLSETKIGNKNYHYGKPAPKGAGKCKKYKYKSPLQGIILLNGTYEVAYAQYLDFKKILWYYEIEIFKLSNNMTYTPDFFLPQYEKFIDTKGYLYPKSKLKIEKFQEEYPWDLEVLYREDLKKLGINVK